MRPATYIPANRLLAALPLKERQHLLAAGERINLVLGEVLCKSGERIRHVYFPTDSVISLLIPVEGHGSLEVGMVGDEGMLGISLLLGVDVSPFHCLVQGAGPAVRINTAAFLREIERSERLVLELKRYLYVLRRQLAQTAACTRFHLVEARLARWLLMSQDRAHANDFAVTQEFLARMLGVRRVGITKAASELRKRKLIDYSRGHMTIVNRRGLEAAACECYAAVNKTYDLVMG